ncbi:MAG: serine/threonine protein kinase, partial [Planctomycetota bacterium]
MAKQFGKLAIEQGYLTPEEVGEALKEFYAKKIPEQEIGEFFLKKKLLTRAQVQRLRALYQKQNIDLDPHILPGYHILQRLGKGGMGAVYKAIQKSMERPVAIKILSPQLTQKKEYVERFFQEAKSVAKLNHPNIISGIDVGEHQGIYYFVMEYVEGENLRRKIKQKGKLPYDEVLSITSQIAQALQHAYELGIVHRDIKPDNILITNTGQAKLCDLGLAKESWNIHSEPSETVLGTPHYISPEQAKGEAQVDIRSDIYSLGATIFHMLTGSPPFDGEEPVEIMKKHLQLPFPPLSQFQVNVPPKFAKILEKMVQKKPQDRFQTPQQLLDALDELQKSSPPPGKQPFSKKNKKSSRHTSTFSSSIFQSKKIWAISAFALLWILLIAFLAKPKPKSTQTSASSSSPS